VSAIEELLERKSSSSGLENREHGYRDPLCWPRNTLYPQEVGTNFTDKYSLLADSDKDLVNQYGGNLRIHNLSSSTGLIFYVRLEAQFCVEGLKQKMTISSEATMA
jgi:hypothetical protein